MGSAKIARKKKGRGDNDQVSEVASVVAMICWTFHNVALTDGPFFTTSNNKFSGIIKNLCISERRIT